MSWIVWGLVAAGGAAGVALLGRVGLQQVDSVLATTLRSFVMSAALLGFALTRGGFGELIAGGARLSGHAWLAILGAGACGALSWLAYFAALSSGPAGAVAALDRLSLPLVVVLGAWWLGEATGPRGWLGVALAIAGIALLVSDQASRST